MDSADAVVFILRAAADLSLTKTVSSPTAILNVEFSYTITVNNTAATAVAENTLVIDTLPAGLVVVDSALPGGECLRDQQVSLCAQNDHSLKDQSDEPSLPAFFHY